MSAPRPSRRRIGRAGRPLLAVGIALIAVPIASTSTAAAKQPPRLFTGDTTGFFGEEPFEVEPAVISYTGDGTGILGGPREPGHRFGSLRWKRWGARKAVGVGKDWINDCKPSCGGGSFDPVRARVQASKVRNGRFRRLTIRFRYHGRWRVDRRVLHYTPDYYFWAIKGHVP